MSNSTEGSELYTIAAGHLATGVVAELGPNLRQIRDSLAILVELLDRHFSQARGPEPYPWTATKALRERLATIYLSSRQAARMAGELGRAVSSTPGPAESLDPNQLVEQSVALSRHRFGEECIVSIDAGEVPSVRGHHGSMVMLLSHLLLHAADAARATGRGGSVDVRTRRHRLEDADYVVFEIANEDGRADWIAQQPLADLILAPVSGQLVVLGDDGHGVAIRLPVPR